MNVPPEVHGALSLAERHSLTAGRLRTGEVILGRYGWRLPNSRSAAQATKHDRKAQRLRSRAHRLAAGRGIMILEG